jgi:hypothetical protein
MMGEGTSPRGVGEQGMDVGRQRPKSSERERERERERKRGKAYLRKNNNTSCLERLRVLTDGAGQRCALFLSLSLF